MSKVIGLLRSRKIALIFFLKRVDQSHVFV